MGRSGEESATPREAGDAARSSSSTIPPSTGTRPAVIIPSGPSAWGRRGEPWSDSDGAQAPRSSGSRRARRRSTRSSARTTPAYLEAFVALDGHHAAIDADTYVSPRSVRAARRAAGGACALVEALLAAPANDARGVALLRPPGHHATRAQAMGFSLLNNAAVAAAHALERRAERVAVVDWDVHHGNGTQDIFWKDPRVLYVSLHQFPLYPGTGHVEEAGGGEGKGYTINVPLSPAAGPSVYADAFEQVVIPVLEGFAPELVLVSAGFDAHERDPLASMRLDDAAYRSMPRPLERVAARSANGRVALLLEGGYDLGAIEGSLAASIAAIAGQRDDAEERDAQWGGTRPGVVSAEHADEIARARAVTARRWRI